MTACNKAIRLKKVTPNRKMLRDDHSLERIIRANTSRLSGMPKMAQIKRFSS